MKTLPSELPVLTLIDWMEPQTHPCDDPGSPVLSRFLPPLSQPHLLSLSEQRKGTNKQTNKQTTSALLAVLMKLPAIQVPA